VERVSGVDRLGEVEANNFGGGVIRQGVMVKDAMARSFHAVADRTL
jgi:hypothetical protein